MAESTSALEPAKEPLESRKRYVSIAQTVPCQCPLNLDIRYREGQKLSVSEQLNSPESLWRTAHLPGGELVKVSTHSRAQSQSTGVQLSKAADKGHSTREIGNQDNSRDVQSRHRLPLPSPSKTPLDLKASEERKGKM
jgi:hypothetical protein